MERELGDALDGAIELVPGRPGQYDITVDGEKVASRGSGWRRLLGGGWPTGDEVAEAIRQHGR